MRKNSEQILKEIKLDQEISKFQYKDLLLIYIDNVTKFKIDELASLEGALKLTENSRILNTYVMEIFVTHMRDIMSKTGLTLDSFKYMIETIEAKKIEYAKIRNNTIKSVPIKFD